MSSRVLAVDPGYDRLGVAVIEGDPSRPVCIWSDVVLPPKGVREARLAVVFSAIREAIETHKPTVLALESLFFTKNQTTGIGVAEARGAVLAAAGLAQLPVLEFSPQQVKLAVTGYGNADKKAVMLMVPKLVLLPEKKRLDDEFDAIALGIAALSTRPR
ncbi:MAG: crossover junction endodeoxyribonuclease RuvC [Candidatus Pacebacteria bacterium]|nr:crossover junction endodeoxyribonuclease RuvC [Candidatus Paceibacterota bacterium]